MPRRLVYAGACLTYNVLHMKVLINTLILAFLSAHLYATDLDSLESATLVRHFGEMRSAAGCGIANNVGTDANVLLKDYPKGYLESIFSDTTLRTRHASSPRFLSLSEAKTEQKHLLIFYISQYEKISDDEFIVHYNYVMNESSLTWEIGASGYHRAHRSGDTWTISGRDGHAPKDGFEIVSKLKTEQGIGGQRD